MHLRRLLLASLLGGVAGSAAWASCGDHLPAQARHLASTPGMQVAFAPRPWPLVVGRHFALDLVLCPAADALLPATVRVDADMPAHRHGMNYRAAVKPLGAGRFSAEGLMFHMPGRWRFIFDIDRAGQTTRVTHEVEVE